MKRAFLLSMGIAASLWLSGCGEATKSESNENGNGGAGTAGGGGPKVSGAGEKAVAAAPGDGLRMRVVREDGSHSSLYQKVVVTRLGANIYTGQPGKDGDIILPWSIFFRLRTSDGKAEAIADGRTYWRVGDKDGKALGWIRKEHVTGWNTRFVLEPISPDADNRFSVATNGGGQAIHQRGKGQRTWCFIHKSAKDELGDDTEYPVILYSGRVEEEGGGGNLKREINKVRNLKLEVMFVVESSRVMNLEYGNITPTKSVQDIARQWVDMLETRPDLKGAVRLGLTEFQDANSVSQFNSRITVPLTSDLNKFLAGINGLKDPTDKTAEKIDDVWAQDTIAGLDTAISRVKWDDNSSKHIVLFGAAAPQMASKGNQPNPLGRPKDEFDEIFNYGNQYNPFIYGWNSRGLTVLQLLQRASGPGGDDYRNATGQKVLHSICVGSDFDIFARKQLDVPNKITEQQFKDFIVDLKRISNSGAQAKSALIQQGKVMHVVLAALREILNRMHGNAVSVYRKVSQNNNGYQGLFLDVAPNAAAIANAAKELNNSVTNAFTLLKKVRDGLDPNDKSLKRRNNTDAVSSAFYKIVDAAGQILKDEGVVYGKATVRNKRGVKWAERKVMIGRDELQKLDSSLLAMYDGFKGMVRKSRRQDVGAMLVKLKAIAAGATTGQSFTAESSLQDVLTDLPLRTSALETTPKSLAVMSGPDFNAWLSKLKIARTRCQDLLSGKAGNSWFELNTITPQSKFTVLRLSELP